jgi:uncharacterized protein (TIGR03437 family)
MIRSFLLLAVGVAACLGPLAGQSSTIRVSTEPSGAIYYVDGFEYRTPQVFTWERGSKHTLRFLINQAGGQQLHELTGIRYTFSGWADDRGLLVAGTDPVQVVTADPNIRSYTATASVEYRVNLLLTQGVASQAAGCGAPGNIISGGPIPGIVYLNGTCYAGTTSFWTAPGEFTLNAFPLPGYVFQGWSVNLGSERAFLRTYNIQSQVTLAANFAPGKRVKFITEPTGRDVLVNRTPTPTPKELPCGPGQLQEPIFILPTGPTALCIGEFDFAVDSRNTLSAPSPQTDENGRLWVFDSWSIGGGQETSYTASRGNVPETIIARFVPGVRVSVVTTPVPLRITVDGRDQASANIVVGAGRRYTVSAPLEQLDSRGCKYVFKGWSNNGPQTQTLTAPENPGDTGIVLTANYELLSRAILRTTVPGVTFKVDGLDCVSPCTLDRSMGSQIRLAVPNVIPVSEVQRYEFALWQDGPTTPERTVTINADTLAVNANYRVMNKLTLLADPGNGALFGISPASPDNFYSSDQQVYVNVEAQQGFRFRRWEGDLEGTQRDGYVPMSAPRFVRALLDAVPYIAPSGVRNAAAETPINAVAPGSLVSIYGDKLNARFESGPSNPLSQLIAGTVVTVGERLLPLIYVSPQQINAQLPYDLEPGTHEVTVSTQGQADIKGTFRVVRNAPGLFLVDADNQKFALAYHEDGTLINAQSPARRNEVITVLGTGFGPFTRRLLEGFATPETPATPLADPVEIRLGSVTLTPVAAVSQPGMVGVVGVRFRLTNDVPRASTLDLVVASGGAASNTVVLPVE